MKIAVLIKQTPDTAELPKISAEEASSGDVKATMVINPWDEFAAEETIRLADRFGGDSVAISLGKEDRTDALKHALAMGINTAVLVDSRATAGGDSWTIAGALAAAVKHVDDVAIVLTGRQSVDGNSGVVHVGVACKLGYNLLTNVTRVVDVADGRITVERALEGGQETVTTALPAVVSVTKEINEPRYPSFMGIRKASRATIPVLTAADLGLGAPVSHVHWSNMRKPEARRTQVQIVDGSTAQEKAARLVEALLAEKVI